MGREGWGSRRVASRPPLAPVHDEADCEPTLFYGPTLSRAMDDYLDELARRGREPRTINAYRRILYAFADRFHIDTRVGELEAGETAKAHGGGVGERVGVDRVAGERGVECGEGVAIEAD